MEEGVLPASMNINKTVKLKQFRKSVSKECEVLINMEELDAKIISYQQVLDICGAISEGCNEDYSSLPRRGREDPEWNPGSPYSQRMLHGNGQTDDVAYQLRSRAVSRSGREMEEDKERAEAVRHPEAEI
jgi:hypothetical protein